jgi:hypothetical protein
LTSQKKKKTIGGSATHSQTSSHYLHASGVWRSQKHLRFSLKDLMWHLLGHSLTQKSRCWELTTSDLPFPHSKPQLLGPFFPFSFHPCCSLVPSEAFFFVVVVLKHFSKFIIITVRSLALSDQYCYY